MAITLFGILDMAITDLVSETFMATTHIIQSLDIWIDARSLLSIVDLECMFLLGTDFCYREIQLKEGGDSFKKGQMGLLPVLQTQGIQIRVSVILETMRRVQVSPRADHLGLLPIDNQSKAMYLDDKIKKINKNNTYILF